LRVRGEYRREDQLAIAVVGSRRCSTYGRRQARRFARGLAGMGFTVVSGMAYGIDSEAHRAALAGRGRTVAVLGEGLACTLSGGDAELALEIAESGALVSELPMEAPARPGNFPPRNRLISGLALGVLVVEAAKRSGSLITARHAGEQGRAVFAVPGPVDSATSRGTHALIRDCAVLVEDARDVVDGLGPLAEALELPPREEAEAAGEPEPLADPRELALNDREREVLALLDGSPCQIDQVIDRTGLAVSIVASTLLTLEIKGLVEKLDGQRYVRRQGSC
jgi:DNA processing protein